MPRFSHRSLDAAGKTVSGQISATSLMAATEQLVAEGLTPVNVTEGSADIWMKLNAPVAFWGRPGKRHVYEFTRDLARLTRSGLPLEPALALTAQTTENKIFSHIIADILKRIRKGESLAASLAAESDYFQPFYVAAVHAGEVAGQLPQALEHLEQMIGRQLEFSSRIRSALIYPSILLFMVSITLILVVTVVLPQFAPLFEGAEDKLPRITQFVMAFGSMARDYGLFLVVGLLAIGVYVLNSPSMRQRLAALAIRSRLGQKLLVPLDVVRAFRTLGGAVDGGVQLDAALPMAAATARNSMIRTDLMSLVSEVRKGALLSTELQAKDWASPVLLQMVRVGEDTGSLGIMLQEASQLMEENYRTSLERFMGLLSPLLTLTMGVVVAVLIGAVLMGMMSVNDIAF